MAKITLADEATDPTTPSAGTWVLYPKSGGWYARDSAGNVYFLAPLADGNKTDITVASSGTVWTINNNAVTLAKLATQAANTILAEVSGSVAVPTAVAIAANKFLARASTGNLAAKDLSDFALTFLDDANAAAVLATLGIASATLTLTNKRITKRPYTVADIAGTPGVLTPEIDTYDNYEITALAHALNIANWSTSTPVQGDQQMIKITPDATPRALTYGTNYVAKAGTALPSTTVASKTLSMLFEFNAGLGKYNLLAVGQET